MPQIILRLPVNTSGADYIIGDVHGSALFHQVVAQLGPHDRLFCVGDLFDRGGQEVSIYQTVHTHPNIYATRGNHEQMFLQALSKKATAQDIALFLFNGGDWVLRDEYDRNKIMAHVQATFEHEGYDLEEIKKSFQAAPKIAETADIFRFISALPYLISVGEGPNAFLVCHADLPCSDEDLNTLPDGRTNVSKTFQTHVLWARKEGGEYPKLCQGKRDAHSTIVYCGHTIIQSAKDSVRPETNHVNLDGGAYETKCFIVVNHHEQRASLVHALDETNSSHLDLHRAAAQNITQHLQHIAYDEATQSVQSIITTLQKALKPLRDIKPVNKVLKLKYENLAQNITTLNAAYEMWAQNSRHWNVLNLSLQACQTCFTEIFPAKKVSHLKKGTYPFRHPSQALTVLENIKVQLDALQAPIQAIKTRYFESEHPHTTKPS
ncbi:MAG: metallophosphoesterase [Gammaproteobacteria bacterium]|nr:metallophosphoesterase [Gammaproteobacteria bacterium]